MAKYVLRNDITLTLPGAGSTTLRAGRIVDGATFPMSISALLAAGASLVNLDDTFSESAGAVYRKQAVRGSQAIFDPNHPEWSGYGSAQQTAWRQQAAWYVDPTNGDDGADGSQATPIKTIRELANRLGGVLAASTTVNLVGTNTESLAQLALRIEADTTVGSNPVLTVQGSRTTTRTGTIASAAVPVPGSNLASQVVDSGVADWTADVGSLLVVTSGAVAGSCAWILKDLGSNTARVSRWFNPTTLANTAAPSAADTYAVVTLTTAANRLPVVLGHSGSNNALVLRDLNFSAALVADRVLSGAVQFQSCKFNVGGLFFAGNRVVTFGCLFNLSSNTMLNREAGTGITATACASLTSTNITTVLGLGATGIYTDHVWQGGALIVQDAAMASLTSCAFFDSTNAAGALNVFQAGYCTLVTSLFGSGNTLGVACSRAGRICLPGITPTLAGTTELSFAGAGTAISPLAASSSVPAASALTTWAQWAASPFSRNVLGYKDGSAIYG